MFCFEHKYSDDFESYFIETFHSGSLEQFFIWRSPVAKQSPKPSVVQSL